MPTLFLGFRAALSSRPVRSVMVFMLVLNNVVVPREITSRADDDVAADEEVVRVFVGTVVDEAGAPVADALVEWGHMQAPQMEREFVLTNAAGEYRLETTRAWQDFRLGVHKSGYGPRWFDGLIPKPEPSIVDFTMSVGKDVTGVVVAPGGVPLPDVVVYAKTGEYRGQPGRVLGITVHPSPYPGPARVATTNERGEFVLHDLAEVVSIVQDGDREITEVKTDRVELTFRRDGKYFEEQVTSISLPVVHVVPSGRRPVTPATTGVVRATVVDTTTLEPVSDFRVRWKFSDNAEAFSSPNGEFTLSEPFLQGQEYEFEVLADDYAPAAANIIAMSADEKPQVTIALTPHHSIVCEVVDAGSGDPLPGVEIVSGVYSPDAAMDVPWSQLREGRRHWMLREQQRLVTDSQGRGTLVEGARPQYQFIIHPGYARAVIEPGMRDSLMTEDKTLRIELQPESRISGRILMESIPGSRFDPFMYHQIGRGGQKAIYENFFFEGVVNAAGEFEFDCLAAGTYHMDVYFRVGDSYHVIWARDVKVGEGENVQVEFGAPAGPYTLRGQAPPFTVVRLSQFGAADPLVLAGYADADGYFEIAGLREGYYNVQIDAYFAATGSTWQREDFVEIAGDTERDFTAVPLLGEE